MVLTFVNLYNIRITKSRIDTMEKLYLEALSKSKMLIFSIH